MANTERERYPIKNILITYINNIVFGEVDENERIMSSGAQIRKGAAQDAKNVALAASLLKADYIQKDDLTIVVLDS